MQAWRPWEAIGLSPFPSELWLVASPMCLHLHTVSPTRATYTSLDSPNQQKGIRSQVHVLLHNICAWIYRSQHVTHLRLFEQKKAKFISRDFFLALSWENLLTHSAGNGPMDFWLANAWRFRTDRRKESSDPAIPVYFTRHFFSCLVQGSRRYSRGLLPWKLCKWPDTGLFGCAWEGDKSCLTAVIIKCRRRK